MRRSSVPYGKMGQYGIVSEIARVFPYFQVAFPSMDITALLYRKIRNTDYARMIRSNTECFSEAENSLLAEILEGYEFNVVQQQALVQAVMQQSRFNPDDFHEEFDDEDVTGICPHCINPPMPPLRDYLLWRETLSKQAT